MDSIFDTYPAPSRVVLEGIKARIPFSVAWFYVAVQDSFSTGFDKWYICGEGSMELTQETVWIAMALLAHHPVDYDADLDALVPLLRYIESIAIGAPTIAIDYKVAADFDRICQCQWPHVVQRHFAEIPGEYGNQIPSCDNSHSI